MSPSGEATKRKRDRSTGARDRAVAVTRERILIAAEQLFSDKGIAAVSLREIGSHARQANSNAVQYHFGTKDNLVRQVFEFRAAQLEPVRSEMLALATQQRRLGDLRTLLQIICLPYLCVVGDDGRHNYAGFLAQYIVNSRLAGVPYPFDEPATNVPALRRARALLNERLSFLPEEMIRPRVQTAVQGFASMLVRYDSGAAGEHKVPLRALVVDTIEQLALGISASYRPEQRCSFEQQIPLFK
ncbi:MAG: TetR/AcrR family transcriptional regulator [Novosphingobium sp.]|nr:TetR/AcrR family transcriptional regulator [Novosphingobium sp.]